MGNECAKACCGSLDVIDLVVVPTAIQKKAFPLPVKNGTQTHHEAIKRLLNISKSEFDRILEFEKQNFNAKNDIPDSLSRELAESRLEETVVTGDGHCLFHSIIDQIRYSDDVSSDLKNEFNGYDGVMLNSKMQKLSEYVESLQKSAESDINVWLKTSTWVEETKKGSRAPWGDGWAIKLFCEFYEVFVEVYVYDGSKLDVIVFTGSSGNRNGTIRIINHGNKHYNSLRKKTQVPLSR